MSIKILVADDHTLVRQGLCLSLETQPDMKVVAEAEDGRQTVKLARKMSPDVIVMDVTMPELNGIDATSQISREMPGIKVVGLSMHADKVFVLEMLKAGASAYLLKDCASEELAHAVRTAISNKIYLSPLIAGLVVEDFMKHNSKNDSSVFSVLSKREREVLQLLAEGKSTKEIASALYVSVKTIETHRRQIMNKLQIHSVAELTKYAVREGLTSLEK